MPRDINPGYDRTGSCCEASQTWPIWFLVGTFEEFEPVERICTVPFSMAIMFPAIVGEKSFIEYPQLRTEDELMKLARETCARVRRAYVEIDGIVVPNIGQFRIRSSPFDLYFPENNIFGVKAGITRSVSEGYWIILDQLACGFHTLRFGGDTYVMDTLEFKTDVTYYLTVK